VFTIRQPVPVLRSIVEVYDAATRRSATSRASYWPIGGGFWVYDRTASSSPR